MSIARKIYSTLLHYIELLIEVFEMLIVLGLTILIVVAFVFFFKDLISIRLVSVTEELNIVITSITIIIVLIELLRTFIVSREEVERYVSGFLEVGIIILVREVAVSTINRDTLGALASSCGILILVIALLIYERWYLKR
jgi:uncharacterized membrane protein (DUF373 family)